MLFVLLLTIRIMTFIMSSKSYDTIFDHLSYLSSSAINVVIEPFAKKQTKKTGFSFFESTANHTVVILFSLFESTANRLYLRNILFPCLMCNKWVFILTHRPVIFESIDLFFVGQSRDI